MDSEYESIPSTDIDYENAEVCGNETMDSSDSSESQSSTYSCESSTESLSEKSLDASLDEEKEEHDFSICITGVCLWVRRSGDYRYNQFAFTIGSLHIDDNDGLPWQLNGNTVCIQLSKCHTCYETKVWQKCRTIRLIMVWQHTPWMLGEDDETEVARKLYELLWCSNESMLILGRVGLSVRAIGRFFMHFRALEDIDVTRRYLDLLQIQYVTSSDSQVICLCKTFSKKYCYNLKVPDVTSDMLRVRLEPCDVDTRVSNCLLYVVFSSVDVPREQEDWYLHMNVFFLIDMIALDFGMADKMRYHNHMVKTKKLHIVDMLKALVRVCRIAKQARGFARAENDFFPLTRTQCRLAHWWLMDDFARNYVDPNSEAKLRSCFKAHQLSLMGSHALFRAVYKFGLFEVSEQACFVRAHIRYRSSQTKLQKNALYLDDEAFLRSIRLWRTATICKNFVQNRAIDELYFLMSSRKSMKVSRYVEDHIMHWDIGDSLESWVSQKNDVYGRDLRP